MPGRDRIVAELCAARIWQAWDADDPDAVTTLVCEVTDASEESIDLVCGLLHVGAQLRKAAVAGQLDTYREQHLGALLIAEATTEDTPDGPQA
ncbi:hypothetical protein [Nonomuraea sp. NPDC023979]|uniref:hypothetical protein n=1 Tax=Nonomuraea sp. NPDC023979 TaxID=3154796 RepID=UPI0033FA4CF3